jgi:MYXO-CTERM domain-containing protein
MNKFSLTLALGTGLVLGVAAPSARAAGLTATTQPTAATSGSQPITTADISASTFNSLFTPVAGLAPQTSSVDFLGAKGAGTLTSQVFVDPGAGPGGANLYAYAYQVSTNNVNDSGGQPVHINAASWQFNATPTGTTIFGNTSPVFGATITDGPIKGFATPVAAAGGAGPAPSSLTWTPGSVTGSVLANFNVGAQGQLNGGDTSAIFTVLSTQAPSTTFSFAGVLSSIPQNGAPLVYDPTPGPISPIPSPEPTTVLAWAGMAGAVALVRRRRRKV